MRTALIILHAAPGVIGLLAGPLSLSPPHPGDNRHRWRQTYIACLVTLIVGLVALVAYDWTDLDTAARIAFTGLVGLAGIMGYRLWRARRETVVRRNGWQGRYLGHLYFTYVALWAGFLVVPALNLPLPQVTVPLVVAAVVATGHVRLTRHRRRLAPT